MAISGLVVRLAEDPAAAENAIGSLARDPRLTLGARHGQNLALVAETDDPERDQELFRSLLGTFGIISVDVTFVSIDPHSNEPGSHRSSGAMHDRTIGSKGVPETKRDGRRNRGRRKQDIRTSDS